MNARHGRDHAAIDEDGRLANKVTTLTLLSLCCFLLALMAMPLTFQRTDRLGPRAIATAPLAAGAGTAFLARAARTRLRALRDEEASAQVGEVPRPGETSSRGATSVPPHERRSELSR